MRISDWSSDVCSSDLLDFLDLSIDEATGTAALRAEFPNPNSALLPGQFVRARIFAGNRADGVLIPQRAVKLAADAASVMVLDAKNRSEEHTSELQSLMRTSYAVFCLKTKNTTTTETSTHST